MLSVFFSSLGYREPLIGYVQILALEIAYFYCSVTFTDGAVIFIEKKQIILELWVPSAYYLYYFTVSTFRTSEIPKASDNKNIINNIKHS